ncbi:hypothetical protein M569_08090 [Genlisea aurea]|uniref:TF-B3 domain-containing protein n=1 Tax=Genlisea aurea TaxID=192259 RepID=S8CPA9_9LAMI|nr:hypothetical protein M569_08090 [Genlisea aurea]
MAQKSSSSPSEAYSLTEDPIIETNPRMYYTRYITLFDTKDSPYLMRVSNEPISVNRNGNFLVFGNWERLIDSHGLKDGDAVEFCLIDELDSGGRHCYRMKCSNE